jgi:hypothetical protein
VSFAAKGAFMLDPNLFEVTREADRWVCRPSVVFVRLSLVLGAGLSALMVWAASVIWRNGDGAETLWVGGFFLVVALFAAGLAVWRWRMGRTPLTVERSGRVCHGGKELCSAGQVQSVRLMPPPSGEGAYDVCLELGTGARKEVPGFAYGSRDNALTFARELAAELRVTVVEGR